MSTKLGALLLASLLLFAGSARADNSSVLTVGALGGLGAAAATNPALAYPRFALSTIEPSDWRSSATGTTTALATACGVDLETRLLVLPRANTIFVGLKNGNSHSVIFDPNDATLTFSNGLEREPAFPIQTGSVEIKPGWWMIAYLPAPEKWDFKGQDSLTASLPLRSSASDGTPACTVSATMQRNTSEPQPQSETAEYSTLDIVLGGGGTFSRQGSIASLGTTGGGGIVELYFFGSVHWGFMFGVEGTSIGSAGSGTAQSATIPFTGVYRDYLSKNFKWQYDLGLGVHSINQTGGPISNGSVSLYNQTDLAWTFGRVSSGLVQGSFSLGISLVDSLIAPDSVNGVRFQGNELGSFLWISMEL